MSKAIKDKLIALQKDIDSYIDGGEECRAHDSMLSDFSREIDNIIDLVLASESIISDNNQAFMVNLTKSVLGLDKNQHK